MKLEGSLFELKTSQINAADAEFSVCFLADCPIFEGHFPQHPIVPGVCLLQMACDLFEKIVLRTLCISSFKNVKFLKEIRPESVAEVCFSFQFEKKEENYVAKCVVSDKTDTFAKMNLNLQPSVLESIG